MSRRARLVSQPTFESSSYFSSNKYNFSSIKVQCQVSRPSRRPHSFAARTYCIDSVTPVITSPSSVQIFTPKWTESNTPFVVDVSPSEGAAKPPEENTNNVLTHKTDTTRPSLATLTHRQETKKKLKEIASMSYRSELTSPSMPRRTLSDNTTKHFFISQTPEETTQHADDPFAIDVGGIVPCQKMLYRQDIQVRAKSKAKEELLHRSRMRNNTDPASSTSVTNRLARFKKEIAEIESKGQENLMKEMDKKEEMTNNADVKSGKTYRSIPNSIADAINAQSVFRPIENGIGKPQDDEKDQMQATDEETIEEVKVLDPTVVRFTKEFLDYLKTDLKAPMQYTTQLAKLLVEAEVVRYKFTSEGYLLNELSRSPIDRHPKLRTATIPSLDLIKEISAPTLESREILVAAETGWAKCNECQVSFGFCDKVEHKKQYLELIKTDFRAGMAKQMCLCRVCTQGSSHGGCLDREIKRLKSEQFRSYDKRNLCFCDQCVPFSYRKLCLREEIRRLKLTGTDVLYKLVDDATDEDSCFSWKEQANRMLSDDPDDRLRRQKLASFKYCFETFQPDNGPNSYIKLAEQSDITYQRENAILKYEKKLGFPVGYKGR